MIPMDLRYGRSFREMSRLLVESQHWSAEQHRDYQYDRLKHLLAHVYENVPFYSTLYHQVGVHPTDIRSLDDIKLLPTISKVDVRRHLNDMKATNFPEAKFQYHTTGGSTGEPLGLFWESDRTVPLERAFMQRQWKWAGFEMEKDRSVILRGIPLSNGALYQHLPGNQLRLSTYDLTEDNIQEYLSIIKEFHPVAIQAYPSAAQIIARHIIDRGGIELPTLRVVLCGSENIYPWQRDVISEAFNCRVYSWYGQSEYVALGGECEWSTDYHFYTEYGITEFISPTGESVEAGGAGEIVATGFNNLAFPLIRYRTEDLARRSEQPLCACGRHYPLVSYVEGRLQEMIVGKRGNLVSMTAINMHTNVFDNVHRFQFYQDTPGVLILNIVRKNSYMPEDERNIIHALTEKLTDQFSLSLQYVDDIELTPRGKSQFLVQRLPLADDWRDQNG